MGSVERIEAGEMMPWCHLSVLSCGSHLRVWLLSGSHQESR